MRHKKKTEGSVTFFDDNGTEIQIFVGKSDAHVSVSEKRFMGTCFINKNQNPKIFSATQALFRAIKLEKKR